MRDRPVCFDCTLQIDYSPVFEAPCGHDDCSSAVFHGVCLMRWRERREEVVKELKKWLSRHGDDDDD